MSHVEFDRLWALSQGQLGAAEAAEARAHLASCPGCAAQLASIELARPMMAPPPVPELDSARWSAIDEKVLAAAAREMARPSLWRTLRSFWDAPLFKPAFAAVAMAAVALLVVFAGRSGTPEMPEPLPVEPIAALPGDLVNEASVLTAVGSSAGEMELKSERRVKRGSVVATRAQGEAWLRLPDGSKLGVLSSTTARLDDLAPRAVRVSLDKGALAVAAIHEPERLLEVSAGRLSVRVVGTRFMVVRDGETSGVVVEEGVVEANVDGKTRMVPAGSSLTVTDKGVEVASVEAPQREQLQEIVPPRPAPPAQPRPVLAPAVAASPDAGAVAVFQPAVPAPEVDEGDEVDDDWAGLPAVPDAGAPAAVAVAVAAADDANADAGVQGDANADAGVQGDAKEQTWWKRQLEKLSRANCRRIFERVDEMTTKWAPDSGVVMTKRRQRNLREGLEKRQRCIEKYGYPAPK